jgi:type I restriction enzyme R subunit
VPFDPNTCLIKLRQFGELLAQLIAANVGVYDHEARQIDLMRRLRDKGILKGKIFDFFDQLCLAGNDATHAFADDQRTALSNLKYARQLGVQPGYAQNKTRCKFLLQSVFY